MKQTTGEFLATLRKANGFTQQEVADKLGISNRTLSSWETDRTAPDLLVLPAIADLYGVTVDEILRGERRNGAENNAEISEKAKRDMRKRRFAQYGTRRALCLGFGLLGGAIFVGAGAVLLYTSAPLWLSILLMVLGAVGCAACVILISCFTYSAVRGEGIVLKEDYTEENKAFVQCVRHGAANSLLYLSLPYIAGAIVFLIVFFAAGLYDYRVIIGSSQITIDYTTPTVTLTCLNIAFALALLFSGYTINVTDIFRLGNEAQRAAAKSNGKLFGKVCAFAAIPLSIAVILVAVFANVSVSKRQVLYFEAATADEVYEKFQTVNYVSIEDAYSDAESGNKITIPEGSYYLNFQSDKFVRLDYSTAGNWIVDFYDLGNGFYGFQPYLLGDDWAVCRLYDGKSADEIEENAYYGNYMEEIFRCAELHFYEHDVIWVVNVAGYPIGDVRVESNVVGLEINADVRLAYYEKEGVFRYEEIWFYDYSVTSLIVFWSIVGATAVTVAAVYFSKRRKMAYGF